MMVMFPNIYSTDTNESPLRSTSKHELTLWPLRDTEQNLYLPVNSSAFSQQMNINKGAVAAPNYKHAAQNGFPLSENYKTSVIFL